VSFSTRLSLYFIAYLPLHVCRLNLQSQLPVHVCVCVCVCVCRCVCVCGSGSVYRGSVGCKLHYISIAKQRRQLGSVAQPPCLSPKLCHVPVSTCMFTVWNTIVRMLSGSIMYELSFAQLNSLFHTALPKA